MSAPARTPPYAPPPLGRGHLARVVAVNDPDGLSRVQVRLLACDGVPGQDAPVWARVAVPFAGGDRGAFMLPSVDDEVLVVFVDGDRRFPIVVGSLWNGRQAAPETLGGAGNAVDRWSFVGRAGTRIAIVEEETGNPTILMQTPGGVSATLSDEGGGRIELRAAGTTLTIDSTGFTLDCGGDIGLTGSNYQLDSGMVTINAGMTRVSGYTQTDTHQSTTVISGTYTPGAGNVW